MITFDCLQNRHMLNVFSARDTVDIGRRKVHLYTYIARRAAIRYLTLRMRLNAAKRSLAAIVCFVLLSDSNGSLLVSTDCRNYKKKCASNFQMPHINILLVLVSAGLVVIPMLFCCYKQTKRWPEGTEKNDSKAQVPPHVYEEIDDKVIQTKAPQPSLDIVKHAPSKDEEKTTHCQADEIPQLPERGYLTDIDFVAQEFDLILRRPPELPQRTGSFSVNKIVSVVDLDKNTSIVTGKTSTSGTEQNRYNLTMANRYVLKPQLQIPGGQKVKTQAGPVIHTTPEPYETPITCDDKVKKGKDSVLFKARQPSPSQSRQQPDASKHRPHKQPLKFEQQPDASKHRPHKQPLKFEQQTTFQRPCNESQSPCPVYQNVTPDDVDNKRPLQNSTSYENVTVDGQQIEEDNKSHRRGQIRQQDEVDGPRSYYQPLMFVQESYDDEYVAVDVH